MLAVLDVSPARSDKLIYQYRASSEAVQHSSSPSRSQVFVCDNAE